MFISKVTIVTGPQCSALSEEYDVRLWRRLHSGSTFLAFWSILGRFLCTKAVHNLKTKSSCIILTPWATFMSISAFLLFLVSEVVRRA